MIHKKTGLKAAQKIKASIKSPGDKHHVCFSSPVTESLTTPPSQNKHTQITPSSSKKNPQKELTTEVTPLRNIDVGGLISVVVVVNVACTWDDTIGCLCRVTCVVILGKSSSIQQQTHSQKDTRQVQNQL
jgi:hypothetical protein